MLLGEYCYEREEFPDLSDIDVLKWIRKQPKESFLLSALVGSVSLREIEPDLDLEMRGKIMGKFIPRDDYQAYFPIGGGRVYPGAHVVTGHTPPDIDTVVASFWSWVDAFAAGVSEGPHLWNLPKAQAPSQVRKLLGSFFGDEVLSALSAGFPESGTVSLRDFCNRDEAAIPDEFEIISVVDHHRANLQTRSFPTALISDVQSTNTLLAEEAFRINDRYLVLDEGEGDSLRLQQRNLQSRIAAATRGPHFVHPKRAFAEYLSFLHAILDDTDLLSRVTKRDLGCVAELINRLKSLTVGHHVEVVDIDSVSARQLLEQEDLYSVYQQICDERAGESMRDLQSCFEGHASHVFVDTKEQKRAARVGQTKIFARLFPWFGKRVDVFRNKWLKNSAESYEHKPHLQIHMHMISTLPGAEDLHRGSYSYDHADELWIWVPSNPDAYSRLQNYLDRFSKAPEVEKYQVDVTLMGHSKPLREIFAKHFPNLKESDAISEPMAVIRFKPGKLTSRKVSITPYI